MFFVSVEGGISMGDVVELLCLSAHAQVRWEEERFASKTFFQVPATGVVLRATIIYYILYILLKCTHSLCADVIICQEDLHFA